MQCKARCHQDIHTRKPKKENIQLNSISSLVSAVYIYFYIYMPTNPGGGETDKTATPNMRKIGTTNDDSKHAYIPNGQPDLSPSFAGQVTNLRLRKRR